MREERTPGELRTQIANKFRLGEISILEAAAQFYNVDAWELQRDQTARSFVVPIDIMPIEEIAHTTRTGTIRAMGRQVIQERLGFAPNIDADEWHFSVNGHRCGVWTHKESERHGLWSTFGSAVALNAVFGANYMRD